MYAIQRLQGLQVWQPLNPQALGAVSPDSSFNTATSFITNTNWQGYAGESTMSYLSQMLALAVQNFASAATGMAMLVALTRGFVRKEARGIGNFWADITRTTVYILLPLSIVFALLLVARGIPQTFDKAATVTLVQPVTYDNPKNRPDGQPLKDEKGNPVTEKATATEQTIPLGPVASQIAIKQLGTNGGGYYNANSAHPLENPTPLTDFLEMLAILLIPAALCYTFGRMIGDTRQGWALLAAMTIVFAALLPCTYLAEQNGNPILTKLGADQVATATNIGGNMEGKEVRIGVANSALWATATTAASNGSVNSMHDSFMPLGGMIPMWLIQLSEVIFGGVGSGLYGMIVYAVVAVFIAGLMIGRTPEYLGKKIGAFEVKMASIAILVPPLLVLCGTALAVLLDAGKAGRLESRRPGLQRDPVRVLVRGQQQRQRVRRPERQHAVLQHGAGDHDAVRPLLAGDPGARAGRRIRRRQARAAVGGHAADAHAAVRGGAHRHGDHGRRPDFRAGPGARPRSSSTCCSSPATDRCPAVRSRRVRHDHRHRATERSLLVSESRPAQDRAHRQLPPPDAALSVAQSGDVRRLHRQPS